MEKDLLENKTVWGLKRLNLAFYISIILGSFNIISEVLSKGILENWAYKLILLIVYGSFILINKSINKNHDLVKYVSFTFGEILIWVLIYFAYVEEPECALIWVQLSTFVMVFYQSYLMISIKSIIFLSVKNTLEWVVAGIYFSSINMDNFAPFVSGIFALPIFIFACTYFEYLQDIDLCKAKKIAEDSSLKISSLIEAIPDNICVISQRLIEAFMNSSMEVLLNSMPISEYLEKLQYHIRYSRDNNIGNCIINDIESAFLLEIGSQITFGVTKRDQEYIEWSGKLVIWEGTLSLILFSKNVSKLIQLEKDSIENQYKSTLLSTVSHELRTPSNAMLSMVDLIKSSGSISEENMSRLDLITSSCSYLLCLINDLLDYSQIMAGSLKISNISFNIEKILNECIKLIQVQLQYSSITLHVKYLTQVPRTLISDPYRIKQILLNLLSNARKFTKSGTISIDVLYNAPNLHFLCQDTGIGIPEEKINLLFKEFGKIHDAQLNPLGVGLGLYISNMLVYELSGSGIKVDSTLGKGSCFSFSVVVQEAENSDEEEIPEENANVNLPDVNGKKIEKNKEILIVDDVYFNILAYMQILKSEGYNCSIAQNGLEAIEAVAKKEFACVLMDCEMPMMNGWEATVELKRMESIGKIKKMPPVIGCTAHSSETVKYQCFASGMVDFIVKPSPRELIIEKINVILSQA